MINNRTLIARARQDWEELIVLTCELLGYPNDKVQLALPQLASIKRCFILENITHEEMLTKYAHSKLVGERAAVARNSATPDLAMTVLRQDSASSVRWAIAGKATANFWCPSSIGYAHLKSIDESQFEEFNPIVHMLRLLGKIISLKKWSEISDFWKATRLPAPFVAPFLLSDEELSLTTTPRELGLTESPRACTAWTDRRFFIGGISVALQTSAFFTIELVDWILNSGNSTLTECLYNHPGIWLDEFERLFPAIDFCIREITSTDLTSTEIRFRLDNEQSGSKAPAIRNLLRMCADNPALLDMVFNHSLRSLNELGSFKLNQSF